jgi:uncharacterized membrane protein HdeD (DUF308 family)
MVQPGSTTGHEPWWACALLGAALIVIALFILTNVVVATLATVTLFGIGLTVAGAFEIVYAFWNKGEKSILPSLLVGTLYALSGLVLLSNPLAATALLTLGFALMLIISGLVRVVLAFRTWQHAGWLLSISGLTGILAGLIILSGWPVSGLWVFGLVLGFDLLLYGFWWLARGLSLAPVKARPAPA